MAAAPPGLTGLDAEKLKLVQDLEIEMMTDMYARLTNACHKKCVPPKYHEEFIPLLGLTVDAVKCTARVWRLKY